MAENNENHPKPNEQTIQTTIQQLWLTYYNDTLYAKGLITEDQRNRMRINPATGCRFFQSILGCNISQCMLS